MGKKFSAWSNNRLRNLLAAGGRPPRKQRRQGVFVDLGRLKSLTLEWSRFRDEVWAEGVASYQKEVDKIASSSVEGLRELLEDAATNLEALIKECQLTLKEVRALKQSVGP